MRISESQLKDMLVEELSKTEVGNMISTKIDSSYNSREFKKAVKELAGDVVNELFKILWQRNSFWKQSVTNQ